MVSIDGRVSLEKLKTHEDEKMGRCSFTDFLGVAIPCHKIWVFPKIVGFSPPNHPLKNRVFHYFHHPFWGVSLFKEILI